LSSNCGANSIREGYILGSSTVRNRTQDTAEIVQHLVEQKDVVEGDIGVDLFEMKI